MKQARMETNSIQIEKEQSNLMTDQEVDVLYQRLGDKWFAFSLINDEVFVGSITEADLEEIKKQKSTS